MHDRLTVNLLVLTQTSVGPFAVSTKVVTVARPMLRRQALVHVDASPLGVTGPAGLASGARLGARAGAHGRLGVGRVRQAALVARRAQRLGVVLVGLEVAAGAVAADVARVPRPALALAAALPRPSSLWKIKTFVQIREKC